MDRADEDSSDDDPQERRQPSPEHPDGRSDDRAGSCNGREVMSEDDASPCRHVVDIILEALRGAGPSCSEVEDSIAQPSPVGVVGDDESETGEDGDQECVHAGSAGNKPRVALAAKKWKPRTVSRPGLPFAESSFDLDCSASSSPPAVFILSCFHTSKCRRRHPRCSAGHGKVWLNCGQLGGNSVDSRCMICQKSSLGPSRDCFYPVAYMGTTEHVQPVWRRIPNPAHLSRRNPIPPGSARAIPPGFH